MSLALIGGLVGLAIALAQYFLLTPLIARAERRGEHGRVPRLLDLMVKAYVIIFPVIGVLAGSVLAGENGT